MKNKLSITQAAKICSFERSYFYKIIKKYNISIKKDGAGKSFIDPAELYRALPSDMINNELLNEHIGNTPETTPTHNTTTQNSTDNNELIDILKKQVSFLEQQLEVSQSQVNSLLDTVNRQTLLLEHHPTTDNNNTKPKETTHNYKSVIDELRRREKKKKKK